MKGNLNAEASQYYHWMVEHIVRIQDEDTKKFGLAMLDRLPAYFFLAPASSSGSNHPARDREVGGLVAHSISVLYAVEDLLRLEDYRMFSNKEKDMMRIAALFHDAFKYGPEEDFDESNFRTMAIHPILAGMFVIRCSCQVGYHWDDANYISDAIASHMGQWNESVSEKIILPKPSSPAQKLLHLADYIASRKDINFVLYNDPLTR